MPQSPDHDGPVPGRDGRPDATSRAAASSGRNLPVAVGSAIVFAVLFLAAAFVNPWVLVVFVVAVVVVGMLEVDAALRSVELRPPTPVVLVGGVAMMIGAFVGGAAGQLGALAATFFGVLLWALTDRDDGLPLRSAGGALLIAVWVPFLASFLPLVLRRDAGEWFVVLIVALTAASDIAAYGVGSRFGRRKLAPAVSPGKTWEGFAGAVVVTVVVAAIAIPWLVPALSSARAAALGAVIAVAGTVGDLAESVVKRSLGVKDLGTFVPGHGGMMDRVDAMLFAFPVAHLVLLAGGL